MILKMSFFTDKDWSFETLWNFENVSPFILVHLKKVYRTLCCAMTASVFGVYSHVLWNIGGILTTLGFIGSMGWLLAISPWKERMRVFLLMVAALFSGASIGHVLELLAINPSKIIIAFLGTAMAFGCFSVAAMSSKRRDLLYYHGLISSSLSILILLLFAYFFGAFTAFFLLYFELLLSYIMLDSQAIIVQARRGDGYYVKHALTFFTDFPALIYYTVSGRTQPQMPAIELTPAEEQGRGRRGRR